MKRKDAFIAKADLFQKVHLSNNLSKADQNSPHIIGTTGNEMWATGEWSATIQGQNFGPKQIKGYWSVIRGDDDWKIRMLTENVTPAPAATPSPTATSSSQWHPDPRPDRLEPGRFD